MTTQLSFSYGRKTIDEQFAEFHQKNPHVYRDLVLLARRARSRGARRVGIGMLFEVIRWRRGVITQTRDGFRLNNNLRSHYARLIMEQEPDLRDIFETRELRAA